MYKVTNSYNPGLGIRMMKDPVVLNYSDLPEEFKNNKVEHYVDKRYIRKNLVKFLIDWYWLMIDIHEGRAFKKGIFNMDRWFIIKTNPKDEHWCGTAACGYGYALAANIVPGVDFNITVRKDLKTKKLNIKLEGDDTLILDSTVDPTYNGRYPNAHISEYVVKTDPYYTTIMHSKLFAYITNPSIWFARSYRHDRFVAFMKNKFPDISDYDLIDISTQMAIIHPIDFANRLKQVLDYIKADVGEPDPNRPWLTKYTEQVIQFVGKGK